MKPKFFSQISDHQQSVARPLRGAFLIPPALLVVADTDHKLDDLVCYCFGYSVNDIEKDFIKNERSLIIEKIAAEKKAGGCDCAKKNPKGR
jgi:hypothetical protein